MDDSMLKSLARRLDIHDVETLRKATELLRLIKGKNVMTNEQAKIIISLECASYLCGTAFNYGDEALKLSGLSCTEYKRQKHLIEKLLGLTKKLQLSDICTQLELNEGIKTDAAHLLHEYKMCATFKDDITSAHCVTMALYQSCKLRKIKITQIRSKLQALSNLNSGKWKKFEEEWNRWIEKETPLARKGKSKTGTSPTKAAETASTSLNGVNASPRVERNGPKMLGYDEWRDSMIKKAMDGLKEENMNQQFVN